MDALTSVVESVLEAFGKKKERESRPVLSTRVPSLRFRTASGVWDTLPVDMVVVGERRYLLRPDTPGDGWVKALDSSEDISLILSDGEHRITVSGLHDRDKPPVLSEFARRGTATGRGWRRQHRPALPLLLLAERRAILGGADGIVFVADSSPEQAEANRESLAELHEHLEHYGRDATSLPVVLQMNKTDLADARPILEMTEDLNDAAWPAFPAMAIRGIGVAETLGAIAKAVARTL